MSKFYETTFFTVLGGIISGAVGLFIADRQRKQDARDTFHVFISQKRAVVPNHDARSFYRNTKNEIRDAVFRLRPFLNKYQKSCLDAVWVEYEQINDNDLHQVKEFSAVAEIMKSPKPDELIKSCMDNLDEIAGMGYFASRNAARTLASRSESTNLAA
jgi:hypothetical protein